MHVHLRMQVRPPSVLAGVPSAMLLVGFLFSPVAMGLHVADNHGNAQEKYGLWRMGLEGRVKFDPHEDSDGDLSDPYEGGYFDGEPDTDVDNVDDDFDDGDFETIWKHSHGVDFPKDGHVAVVLRGASFRGSYRRAAPP